MKLNLNNFGDKLKLKKRNKKKDEPPSEYEMFIETIDLLNACWVKSSDLYERFKVNLIEYEEDYFQVIENLLNAKYGPWKAELILWYIFGRVGLDGEISSLVIQHKDTGEDEEIFLKTSDDLWNFLERLDKIKKDKEE